MQQKPLHPLRLQVYRQRTALRIYLSGGQVQGTPAAQQLVAPVKCMFFAMLYGASPQAIIRTCQRTPLFTFHYGQ